MKRYGTHTLLLMLIFCLLLMSGCSSEISTRNLSKDPAKKEGKTAISPSKKAGASNDAPAALASTKKSSSAQKSHDTKSPTTTKTTASTKSTARTQKKSVTSASTTSKNSSSESKPTSDSNDSKITVSLSIDCKTAVEGGYKEALALTKTGTLAQKTLTLKKGASVYDALKASGCSVGSQSTAMGVYIYSISSLAEKACGSKSGWLYSVNGSFVSKSSDSYLLKNGDSIRWRYTCDGGKDV